MMAADKTTLVPLEHEMVVYHSMATQATDSKFYRSYGDTAAIMTIMLSAREIGISPMTALNGGLNIIKGKVEISARIMNALIRRAGHSVKTVESNAKICTLQGKRTDNGDTETVSFSMDDAKLAKLVRPDSGWTKFPADMLYARALSRLARRLFPDVIGCAYVEGEIVEPKAETPQIEEKILEAEVEETVPKEFLDLFERDEAIFMAEYVKQVHDKYDLTYDKIIDKYHTDMKSFMVNFENWKTKRNSSEIL